MRQDQYEVIIDPETGEETQGERIPFSDFKDYRKLSYLVPEAQCNTRSGVITTWMDERPQPTYDEIEAVLDADVDAAELEKKALALDDIKPVITSLMEIIYENPDLVSSFPAVGNFKDAVKDRYKSKL